MRHPLSSVKCRRKTWFLAQRGFLDVVYDSPEKVTVGQAMELLDMAGNGRGCGIGCTADIRGNAWLALALVRI